MTGSTDQRTEVWKGNRLKTSGGLYRKDLIKNKRGKIVSKAKSSQASSQNNLGNWLREKGKKGAKAEMLRTKSEPPSQKKSVPKAKPKSKPAPKAAPKKPKPAPAPKPKPKPVAKPQPKAPKKRAPKKKRAKAKAVEKINPLTNQPYDPEAKHKISIDNIRLEKKRKGWEAPGW